MSSPASQAGLHETCPRCGSARRVPQPTFYTPAMICLLVGIALGGAALLAAYVSVNPLEAWFATSPDKAREEPEASSFELTDSAYRKIEDGGSHVISGWQATISNKTARPRTFYVYCHFLDESGFKVFGRGPCTLTVPAHSSDTLSEQAIMSQAVWAQVAKVTVTAE